MQGKGAKEGRKEGPTGKRDLKQPTLSSFLSIKGRLKGPDCQRKPEEGTSGATSQGEIGKGPLLGSKEGRQQELGEGRERPRSFIKGSPEHNLLTEAGLLKLGGGCVPGSEETGKETSGGAVGRKKGRPPDSWIRKDSDQSNGKMVGPRVGSKNPSSRASEGSKKVPRSRLFPRE